MAHEAAKVGDLAGLKKALKKDKTSNPNRVDKNSQVLF